MFGQVLEKLDLWVGRSFLLASFFPLLIFVAANAVMAQILTPGTMKSLTQYLSDNFYGPATVVVVCLIAIAALAYVIDPLVGTMTRFLEGAYFPEPVTRWLATDQTRRVRDLQEEEQLSGKRRTDLHSARDKLLGEISTARDIGVAIGAMRNPSLVNAAKAAIEELNELQDQQRPILSHQLEAAARPLKKALEENCAEPALLVKGGTEDYEALSLTLSSMYFSLIRLINYARSKAINEYSVIVDEKETAFSIDELPSTEFGNQTAALRGFFQRRFNMDFQFFWPIIQIIVQSDQKVADSLVNAKQNLDFCIRVFLYTLVFIATWLAAAAFTAESGFVVPLLGTCGLAAAALWLEIIHASYRAFADQVRSIVILKRFDLLKQLHYQVPASWEDEKKTWDRVSNQLRWGSSEDAIAYQHPEK
jgi:hypothetical protein